jgi:hypothetical protein
LRSASGHGSRWSNPISPQELEALAEEAATERERLQMVAQLADIRKQLSTTRTAFRDAALVSKRRVDAMGMSNKRADLLKGPSAPKPKANMNGSG